MGDTAAIVLAGGAARRLGGVHKPALDVGGLSIVGRVLRAVQDAGLDVGLDVVVVGGREGVPPGVAVVREDPPGGGPVAAVAEGLRHLLATSAPDHAVVVLLAGDLPFLTAESLTRLVEALASGFPAGPAGQPRPSAAHVPKTHLSRAAKGVSLGHERERGIAVGAKDSGSVGRSGQEPAVDLAVYLDGDGQPQWLCSAWRVARLRERLADLDAPRGIRGLAAGLRRRELADPDGAASTDVDTPADLAAARVRSGHGAAPDAGPDAAAVRVGDHAEPGAGSGPAGR